jgi:hypothetical protein
MAIIQLVTTWRRCAGVEVDLIPELIELIPGRCPLVRRRRIRVRERLNDEPEARHGRTLKRRVRLEYAVLKGSENDLVHNLRSGCRIGYRYDTSLSNSLVSGQTPPHSSYIESLCQQFIAFGDAARAAMERDTENTPVVSPHEQPGQLAFEDTSR